MQKGLTLAFYLALLLLGFAQAGQADVTSTALIENAAELDNQTVEFEGEAVGDVMLRGDHAWVNVSDGANAVGIWCPVETLPTIAVLGRYQTVGDRLHVRGQYHRACPQHGGDLDIHAVSVQVVERGRRVPQRVAPAKIAAAGIAALCALALGVPALYKKHKGTGEIIKSRRR